MSAPRNAAIYGKNAFQEVPESLTLYRRWENNASKNFMRFAEGNRELLDTLLLEGLTGLQRKLWKRRIEARIYFNIALGLREIRSERYWEYDY